MSLPDLLASPATYLDALDPRERLAPAAPAQPRPAALALPVGGDRPAAAPGRSRAGRGSAGRGDPRRFQHAAGAGSTAPVPEATVPSQGRSARCRGPSPLTVPRTVPRTGLSCAATTRARCAASSAPGTSSRPRRPTTRAGPSGAAWWSTTSTIPDGDVAPGWPRVVPNEKGLQRQRVPPDARLPAPRVKPRHRRGRVQERGPARPLLHPLPPLGLCGAGRTRPQPVTAAFDQGVLGKPPVGLEPPGGTGARPTPDLVDGRRARRGVALAHHVVSRPSSVRVAPAPRRSQATPRPAARSARPVALGRCGSWAASRPTAPTRRIDFGAGHSPTTQVGTRGCWADGGGIIISGRRSRGSARPRTERLAPPHQVRASPGPRRASRPAPCAPDRPRTCRTVSGAPSPTERITRPAGEPVQGRRLARHLPRLALGQRGEHGAEPDRRSAWRPRSTMTQASMPQVGSQMKKPSQPARSASTASSAAAAASPPGITNPYFMARRYRGPPTNRRRQATRHRRGPTLVRERTTSDDVRHRLVERHAVALRAVAVAERDRAVGDVLVAGDRHERDLLLLRGADLLLHPVVARRPPRPGCPRRAAASTKDSR